MTTRSVAPGLVIAVIAVAGCGTDQVTAHFDVQSDEITDIHLVVYEETTVELSCDALAFSKIEPDDLAQAIVVEVEAARGERVSLGPIPRDGNKLFFAEGLTANGTSVVAGCKALGPIDGDAEVDILVEPRLVFIPLGGLEISDNRLEVNNLLVTDLAGNPRGETEIRWTLIGPNDFTSEGSVDLDGIPATITDVLPAQPGPLRLQIYARWAEPIAQTAVQVPDEITFLLPSDSARTADVAEPLQVGRLGSAVGIVALVTSVQAPITQTAELFCFAPDSFDETQSSEPVNGVTAMALVNDPDGGKVVGVSQSEWFEITCGGTTAKASPFVGRPTRAVTFASCDPEVGDPAVYVQNESSAIAATPDGVAITNFDSPLIDPGGFTEAALLATSGCVNDALETHSTLVLELPRNGLVVNTQLSIKTDNVTRTRTVAGQVTASSAFPATDPGTGGLQLGLITEEGPQIGHYDLQLVGSQLLSIDQVSADPTPSQVTAIASGDIDGDDRNDVVALVAFADSVQVFMSLAREDPADRLRGFFPGPVGQRSARLRVFDVDGDRVDDIVLLGDSSLSILDMAHVAE